MWVAKLENKLSYVFGPEDQLPWSQSPPLFPSQTNPIHIPYWRRSKQKFEDPCSFL
jgi:hypothetical protein